MHPHERPIVVLDFGAQYSKLIARRVREASVQPYRAVRHFHQKLKALNPAGSPSAGPSSVHAEDRRNPRVLISAPVLGICYGVQLFADMLGGNIKQEYGTRT